LVTLASQWVSVRIGIARLRCGKSFGLGALPVEGWCRRGLGPMVGWFGLIWLTQAKTKT
jgi:hypothetical protein